MDHTEGSSAEPAQALTLADHSECQALNGLATHLMSRGMIRGHAATHVREAESLYRAGDRTDHFYLVQTGRVRATAHSQAGRDLWVGEAGPGETVGELCFCSVRERQETAVALTDTTVVAVYGEDVITYVQGGRDAARDVLEYLFHRIGELSSRVEALAFQNVRERLIHDLLRLAEEVDAGRHPSGGADASVPIPPMTHEEWATRIYTTREQVSAILAELRRLGAIEYRGRGGILANPSALRRALQSRSAPRSRASDI